MVDAWPTSNGPADDQAEQDFAVIRDLVTELRRFRSQNDVKPSRTFRSIATTRRDR